MSKFVSEFIDVHSRCVALLATCTAAEMGRIDSYGVLTSRSNVLVAARRKLAVIESVRWGLFCLFFSLATGRTTI